MSDQRCRFEPVAEEQQSWILIIPACVVTLRDTSSSHSQLQPSPQRIRHRRAGQQHVQQLQPSPQRIRHRRAGQQHVQQQQPSSDIQLQLSSQDVGDR